ncbi:MAG: MarR family transcriptional regulator [Thermoplasmata archaeon]|jgi:DNA-binding MarR family transcriptional regulator|nr:MarR family transcriptional regulator [Candidatus Sysuiplasma jiujiangense]MBX8639584.1 MarR family transcriptional regulator [Candidatus Sysuiplasma jiujiangense]MBX8641945.1 MarR family transcriptional regulator [Candidatus Sysuiplasma jiujiangense]
MSRAEKSMKAWSNFIDAARMMKRDFDRELGKCGISFIEFKIISILEKNGPMTMVAISEELILTKAGVTLLTDRLEEKGLLERTRKEGDRRLIYVSTTVSGRQVFREANQLYLKLVQSKLDLLSSNEVESLIEIMEKMKGLGRREHSTSSV